MAHRHQFHLTAPEFSIIARDCQDFNRAIQSILPCIMKWFQIHVNEDHILTSCTRAHIGLCPGLLRETVEKPDTHSHELEPEDEGFQVYRSDDMLLLNACSGNGGTPPISLHQKRREKSSMT